MKVFLSYSFDERNKWIEDLVIPIVTALGFEVVNGRRMAGELLNDAVDERLRQCAMCLAFTTRRYPNAPRPDGTFETHGWVVKEMTSARNWGIKAIEIREDKVRIGDGSDAYVGIWFTDATRDRLLSDLAVRLADFRNKAVTVQLIPPAEEEILFRKQALKGEAPCAYEIEKAGVIVATGETKVKAIKGGYFVDIEVPPGDFIVKLKVTKPPAGAWMSFGDGLVAIPINLYDT